jgi:hypothetical protein
MRGDCFTRKVLGEKELNKKERIKFNKKAFLKILTNKINEGFKIKNPEDYWRLNLIKQEIREIIKSAKNHIRIPKGIEKDIKILSRR